LRRLHSSRVRPASRSKIPAYFGGGGVKISRFAGSGFGFGFGAFLTSLLPLSLFPMYASMTQTPAAEKPHIVAPRHFDVPRPVEAPTPSLRRFLPEGS
jgi:hypothetical protein